MNEEQIILFSERIPRRERERLLRRQEILDAACRVFANKGFNEATLEDVAELAEFGKGTLYNYFPNKESLFASVLENSFEKAFEITSRIFSSDEPFDMKIEQYIRETLTFFFSDPESFHLMTREANHLRGGNPMLRLVPQLLAIIAESIAAEQRNKGIKPELNPMNASMLLMHLLFGQFMFRCFQCASIKVESNDESWYQRLLTDIKSIDVAKESDEATNLIMTVFLHGIKHETA